MDQYQKLTEVDEHLLTGIDSQSSLVKLDNPMKKDPQFLKGKNVGNSRMDLSVGSDSALTEYKQKYKTLRGHRREWLPEKSIINPIKVGE